jgi:hypothetical protein
LAVNRFLRTGKLEAIAWHDWPMNFILILAVFAPWR